MKVYLIRHGETPGNKVGRYIGVTDEPLTEEAVHKLENLAYPQPGLLFASPLTRCRQTAKLLYPKMEAVLCADLAECNFGLFENKNWKELSGNPDYQRWIDSNGTLPFPEGENPMEFRKRCCDAFAAQMEECHRQSAASAAFVVHGGTIMSIMERYARPRKNFYDWHVKNGQGYEINVEWQQEGGWVFVNYKSLC